MTDTENDPNIAQGRRLCVEVATTADTEQALERLHRHVYTTRTPAPRSSRSLSFVLAGVGIAAAAVVGVLVIVAERDSPTPTGVPMLTSPPVLTQQAPTTSTAPASTAPATTATTPPPKSTLTTHMTAPAEVDMMRQWPTPPTTLEDVANVPRLLPGEPVPAATSASRVEWSAVTDTYALIHYYQQYIMPGTTQYLTITTRTAAVSTPPQAVDIPIPGWDLARTTSGVNVISIYLSDPSGWVDIVGHGVGYDTMLGIAESLRRRSNGPGWELTASALGGMEALSEGWGTPAAGRTVTWLSSSGVPIVELTVTRGSFPTFDENLVRAAADVIRVGGHKGVIQNVTEGIRLTWSIEPGVTVQLSTHLDYETTIALARSLVTVDEVTWVSSSTVASLDPEGSCGFFGC
jgi:hypothetical protein